MIIECFLGSLGYSVGYFATDIWLGYFTETRKVERLCVAQHTTCHATMYQSGTHLNPCASCYK